MTVERLPHQLRLASGKALVIAPGRASLCLRCKRPGYIGENSRVTEFNECSRFGHTQDECVRTYAFASNDNKPQDEFEFLDEFEVEEGSPGL